MDGETIKELINNGHITHVCDMDKLISLSSTDLVEEMLITKTCVIDSLQDDVDIDQDENEDLNEASNNDEDETQQEDQGLVADGETDQEEEQDDTNETHNDEIIIEEQN